MNTPQVIESSERIALGERARARPDVRRDIALLLVRIAAAAPLFFHGSQKLFGWFGGSGLSGFASYLQGLGAPVPMVAALLAAASETFGAVVFVSGRGFRTLLPVIFTMFVAVVTTLRSGFDVQRGGAEFPLTLLFVLVGAALLGPGALVVRVPRSSGDAR